MRNENVISRVAAFLIVALLLMSQTGFANDYNDRVQVTFERVGREYHSTIRDTFTNHSGWNDVFALGLMSERAPVNIFVTPETIIALMPYEYREDRALLFVESGWLAGIYGDEEVYVLDMSVIEALRKVVINSLLKASKEVGLDDYYPVVIIGLQNLRNGGTLVKSLTYRPVGADQLLGGKFTITHWGYAYDPDILVSVSQGSHSVKQGVYWDGGKYLLRKEVKRDIGGAYPVIQPLLWFFGLEEANVPNHYTTWDYPYFPRRYIHGDMEQDTACMCNMPLLDGKT